jgi:hypothetical protein
LGLPTTASVPADKYEDPLGLALPPASLPFLDAWKRPDELVQGAPSVPVVLLRPAADGGVISAGTAMAGGSSGGLVDKKGGVCLMEEHLATCISWQCSKSDACILSCCICLIGVEAKAKRLSARNAQVEVASPLFQALQWPTATWRGGFMQATRALTGCLPSSTPSQQQR